MADSRSEIINQLKQLKFIHQKTQASNVLAGASVDLLQNILNQVKNNGNNSGQAKQMVKDQAYRQNGNESAQAVEIQLNDKEVAQKISQLRQIQIDVQSQDSEGQIEALKDKIQSLIVACQKGNSDAIKLMKSFDLKDLKGVKNASQVMKQLDKQANKTGVSLDKYKKIAANAFRPNFSSLQKTKETFQNNKKAIQDATKSFQDFKSKTKGVFDSIKNFDISKLKQLSKLDIGAAFLTAIQGADAFHKKIGDVNKKIMDYHRSSQTIMGANSDIMPGGAKQLDQVRRGFNLTREQAVTFAKSMTAVRGTTYGIGDITKAMQGMKKTLGQVDVSQLQKLTQVMKQIPKQQMDAFTSGTGDPNDVTNAIMNMQATGQTQNVLQLGANGAFGQDFAKASGTNINQYQKKYKNNQRAVTTATETLQNKAQQTATSNALTGNLMAGLPFASAGSKMNGVLTMGMGILGLGGKGGNKTADTQLSDQQANVSQKQGENSQQNKSSDKKQTKENLQKILKDIDKRIKDLPKKKFSVDKVNNVKSVGKLKQVDLVKKINHINNINNVKNVQNVKGVSGKDVGGKDVKGKFDSLKNILQNKKGKGGSLKDKALSKLQNVMQKTNRLTQKNGQSLSKTIKDISGKSEQTDFDLSSFFDGKMPDFSKLKQSFKNFDFKDLKKSFSKIDFSDFKNLKNLKDLKNLANFKNLLKLRKTNIGKTAIKTVNAGKRIMKAAKSGKGIMAGVKGAFKAFNAGKAAKGAAVAGKVAKGAKAAATGVKIAKGVATGVKGVLTAMKVGGVGTAGVSTAVAVAIEAAMAAGLRHMQDKIQRDDINKTMGIKQKSITGSGLGDKILKATPLGMLMSGTAAKAFLNNGGGMEGAGKALEAGWLDLGSKMNAIAQFASFGLWKQSDASKQERNVEIAALSQDKYSVQGFKEIYKINKRVNELKQINMQRNQYMAKQYGGFMERLKAIETAYTRQQALTISVNAKKMDNAYQMGMSNTDYSASASTIAKAAQDTYSIKSAKLNEQRRKVMSDSNLTDSQRTVELLQLEQEQIKARQQFLTNLKKSLDCSKIPSIIQNGFKRQINAAVIETNTIGYGGDDQAMFNALGDNIAMAVEDFTAATSFNMNAVSTISQTNSKALQSALHEYNSAGSKADDNLTKALNGAFENSTAKESLIGDNDGGDIKGAEMGDIAHRVLTQKQIQALAASGLADADDIANLRNGGKTLAEAGNGELNDSFTEASKQQAIKKLSDRFQAQMASGDKQGAQATMNIMKGLHTAMKGRGAAGQNFTALVDAMQQKLIVGGRQGIMQKNGVDYSQKFSAQSVQGKASNDAQFMKFLQGKGLANNGVVDVSNKQMLKNAYQQYRVDAGISGSFSALEKSSKQFADLVKANGGDQEKAFAQFQQQLQTQGLGLDKKTVRDSNDAIQKAASTGSAEAMKKNKDQITAVFDASYNKATQDKDRNAIAQGKKALARLNSGQKLDKKTQKQLIAKVEAANGVIANMSNNLNANARAAVQNVIALRKVKNSQLKPAQLMAQVFKGQTDAYKKLNQSILSLQNAVQKSASVQRALIKAQYEQSKVALTTWAGGDVGNDMFSAHQADLKASQAKSEAADRALSTLKKNKGAFDKLAKEGGASFNDLDKLFTGNLDVKVDGDKTFKQSLTQMGDVAKGAMNAKTDQQQEDARKKISDNQKKLLEAIDKSGLSKNQKQMRKNAIKNAANTARQMVGSEGTVKNVQLKLLTQKNQAQAEAINKIKSFAQTLATATQGLQGFHASSISALASSKQKLARKQMAGAAVAVNNLNVSSQALTTQYADQRRQQQTKITKAQNALQQARAKYNADPSKENKEALMKAQVNANSAEKGMVDIDLGQMQARSQAFSSAIDVITTQASMAAESLRIMQDAAENVAGTTAQWYKLQNQKLGVMQKQVDGIRSVVQSKDFQKLSTQQQMKYKNMLAQKQLALTKERIGAQRTVFEKQLGAIMGGFQSQGAFQGFNNAAVFGIGHGINQAGMAVQRQNQDGAGYTSRTLGRQNRTSFNNQGTTTLSGVGQNAEKMGTAQGASATNTTTAESTGKAPRKVQDLNDSEKAKLNESNEKVAKQQAILDKMKETGAYSDAQIKAQQKKVADAKANVDKVQTDLGMKNSIDSGNKQKKDVMADLLKVTTDILKAITGGLGTNSYSQSGGAGGKSGGNNGNGAGNNGQNTGNKDAASQAAADKKSNAGGDSGGQGSNGVADQNKQNAAPGSNNSTDTGKPPQNNTVPTNSGDTTKPKPKFVVFGDEQLQGNLSKTIQKSQSIQKTLQQHAQYQGSAEKRLGLHAKFDAEAAKYKANFGKEQTGMLGEEVTILNNLKNKKKNGKLTKQEEQQLQQLTQKQYYMSLTAEQKKEYKDSLKQGSEESVKSVKLLSDKQKQLGQLGHGQKILLEKSKAQQKGHFEILTGVNGKATKQQKQDAIDYWHNMTEEQRKRSGIAQQDIDQFVIDSVNRGQQLQFKKVDKRKIAQQNKDKISALTDKMLGGTKSDDKTVSKQYTEMQKKARQHYKGVYDFDKLSPQQKYNIVQGFAQQQATQQIVDPIAKKQQKQDTRMHQVAANQKFENQAAKIFQQNNSLGENKVTAKDVQKHIASMGKDAKNMSEHDLKKQTAKLVLKRQREKMQKQLDSLDKEDPANIKRIAQLNKSLSENKQREAQLQKNSQEGQAYARQKTTKKNQLIMDAQARVKKERQAKDKKLLDTKAKIDQQTGSYQALMKSSGLTQQQFKKMFGQEGKQTDQQKEKMAKYQQQRQKELLRQSGDVKADAKSRFEATEKKKAEQMAQQGKLYVEKNWDTLSQQDKNKWLSQSAVNAQADIQKAQGRKKAQQKRDSILKQHSAQVDTEIGRLLAESDSSDKAATYFRRKNIDFAGADKKQQEQLKRQYARETAQNTVVAKNNNGNDLRAEVQMPNDVVGGKAKGSTQYPGTGKVSSNAGGGGNKSKPTKPQWEDNSKREKLFQRAKVPEKMLKMQQTAKATTQAAQSGYFGDGSITVALQGLQQFVRNILKQALNSANNQSQSRGNY